MYIVVWRYRIEARLREAFVAAYEPGGEWARLFRDYDGYIRTELLMDSTTDEYMTIDYWRDIEAFISFRQKGGKRYRELDEKCSDFTTDETFAGAFSLERADARW